MFVMGVNEETYKPSEHNIVRLEREREREGEGEGGRERETFGGSKSCMATKFTSLKIKVTSDNGIIIIITLLPL